MRKLGRLLVALVLCLSCFGWLGQQPAQAVNLQSFTLSSSPILASLADERNSRKGTQINLIDLNNDHVRKFRKYRGFFPTLAREIVKNSPYDEVEDVLDIPGLSDKQKKRLQANLDKFIVTPPVRELNEGDERLNPGVY